MQLAPGTRLGGYEILQPLGSGGMGEVYRAKDLRLKRQVAVKVLAPDMGFDADRLARFEREAQTLAGLNHPNVVTLHSVEESDGIRFLTMELVEGQTLAALVVPGGLPASRILELAVPLAEALIAAHGQGVIHRDLKPGNVMVTAEGRVKVLDFGLAKLTEGNTSSDPARAATRPVTMTASGEVMGTLPYMSPEQVSGERVDARTDLFSFGVILYELATGRRPFNGETRVDVSHAILHAAPEPVTRFRGDLPGEIGRIVDRCLQKRTQDRFQTATDLADDLQQLRRALTGGSSAGTSKETFVSIAVLPFVNRSRDEEDEYFSDGLADELLDVLSKIRGLRVAARTSAFHFKGKDVTIAEIGHALNVSTVLEGSLRKAGNRLRISVQLVKVADGYQLWSETYDRNLDDIFAVQDDIAQSVVKELRTTLLGEDPESSASGRTQAEVVRAARGRTNDPEAHRLYLLARYLDDRHFPGDSGKAIEHLKEAVTRDPGFALAWAELSRAEAYDSAFTPVKATGGFERARHAAERALTLEPDLSEAHVVMGWVRLNYDWDFEGAERCFSRARHLAPRSTWVLRVTGVLAAHQGRFEKAIEIYRRSLEQDPLGTATYSNLGIVLDFAGRFAEAQEAFRKVLELSPGRVDTHASLALTLAAQGRLEEALESARAEPGPPYRLRTLAILHDAMGHREESDASLNTLIRDHGDTRAYDVALVHAARGEADAAFQWLERAYDQRNPELAEVKANRFFGPVRGDPRYGAFLKKMGLAG